VRIVTAFVLAALGGEASLSAGRAANPGGAFLDDGEIRIGADLAHGGSIGFLADAKNGVNIVNVHDFGRYIGQSYYCGPRPFGVAHPGWPGWPWNPVSAGDVYGNCSKLLESRNDGKTLYVKSTPMQWALRDVPGDCQFETWITLRGRTATVRNRLTNQRLDYTRYPGIDQELPALYTVGTLHRLLTYNGDHPFTGEPGVEIPKQEGLNGSPKWTPFFATESWAALVDEKDWGLGLIRPGMIRFLGGFHGESGRGGAQDDPTGYLAQVQREILDANIVYEYSYTLVLDNVINIRKAAEAARVKTPSPDYHFARDRQHWWFLNAEDSGYPVQGHLHLKLEKDDPQMHGPEELWDAAKVPVLYIRAAYQTKNTQAEIFWETTEQEGFGPERRVGFTIVPDGTMRTYEVPLKDSAAYHGQIRRLRLDPAGTGGPGEWVDVESISGSKPAEPAK
jgi:hypothetical protein